MTKSVMSIISFDLYNFFNIFIFTIFFSFFYKLNNIFNVMFRFLTDSEFLFQWWKFCLTIKIYFLNGLRCTKNIFQNQSRQKLFWFVQFLLCSFPAVHHWYHQHLMSSVRLHCCANLVLRARLPGASACLSRWFLKSKHLLNQTRW